MNLAEISHQRDGASEGNTTELDPSRCVSYGENRHEVDARVALVSFAT
jgi:hypothetical protein